MHSKYRVTHFIEQNQDKIYTEKNPVSTLKDDNVLRSVAPKISITRIKCVCGVLIAEG